MTWRSGLKLPGKPWDKPRVMCDTCPAFCIGVTNRGELAAWARTGKAPPGWLLTRTKTTRRDTCPACRKADAERVERMQVGMRGVK